jgi:hypothetical protein
MEIKQVDECSFGGPNSDLKKDSNDSKKKLKCNFYL